MYKPNNFDLFIMICTVTQANGSFYPTKKENIDVMILSLYSKRPRTHLAYNAILYDGLHSHLLTFMSDFM